MRIVIAMGGNALLQPHEEPTAGTQRRNVADAARAVGRVAADHEVVVTHGNGPQVGMLALRAMTDGGGSDPLDVLGAETEGMIGYLLAQELTNALPSGRVATLLTQVEVDPEDPAFGDPVKPIGPTYATEAEARRVAAARGWRMTEVEAGWRRVVPSPRPLRILEVGTLRLLVEHGVVTVCAGGGGIPVVFDAWGRLHGVEAVIDKDRTAALLARELDADGLVLLTDVDHVVEGWGTDRARPLERVTVAEARRMELDPGSMGPKVEACATFVEETGGWAAIGCLDDAAEVVAGEAGTRFVP